MIREILWETLNYLAETRFSEGKKTIVLSDSTKLYDEHGSLNVDNVINLCQNTPVTNYSHIANFVGTSGGTGLYD